MSSSVLYVDLHFYTILARILTCTIGLDERGGGRSYGFGRDRDDRDDRYGDRQQFY